VHFLFLFIAQAQLPDTAIELGTTNSGIGSTVENFAPVEN